VRCGCLDNQLLLALLKREEEEDARMRAGKGSQTGYDHEILLLQGGGALGAYQAGVYEGLAELSGEPTWIVGISIGGINAALIAGNPPERRVERLREFWRRMSVLVGPPLPAWLDEARPAVNFTAAMSAVAFGIRGFFRPRATPPWLAPDGAESALSMYDTSPLKATLEELVDFDLINSGEVRLSLGAVNVRRGVSVYFDTESTVINADHVRASGALPPGFPPVTIDGESYWDGGVVTNTPLSYVADERPMTTARIFQVDTFNARGEAPRTLGQVMERAKDIQYASKSRFNVEQLQKLGELKAASRRLLDKLPPELKSDPDAETLAEACDERSWEIIRLINTRPSRSGVVKDFEFSRDTIEEAWTAGLEDVRRSVAGWDRLRPHDEAPGIRVYRPTEALPAADELSARKRLALARERS
jgi:NTE family protein